MPCFNPRESSVSIYDCYRQQGDGSKLDVKETISESFQFFVRNQRKAKKYAEKSPV